MARLPHPGGDRGQWGEILNDYLSQSLTSDGLLVPGSVSTPQLSSDVTTLINSKASTSSLAQVATTGNYTDLTNKPTIPVQSVISVAVTTGVEARPTATTVLWLGGSIQPTNMIIGDLWFSTEPAADTIAPSAPAGLSASSILSSSFALTWVTSTDNIGVTGYEVFVDNVSYAIVASNSITITGRASSTSYSCTVRARDAGGNWSPLSIPYITTTAESTSLIHTVFDTNVYPGLNVYANGPTPLIVASGFYTGPTGTSNWKVIGMRLYIPAGVSVQASATAYLFTPSSGAPNLANSTQAKAIQANPGVWNEVLFDAPYTLTSGKPIWLGYQFSDNQYLSSTALGSIARQASDGSLVFFAEQTMNGGLTRNYYREGTSSTDSSTIGDQGYGIDIIVSEV